MNYTSANVTIGQGAQAIPALEQRHAMALRLQFSRGADAAHAGAHHQHVLGLDSRRSRHFTWDLIWV